MSNAPTIKKAKFKIRGTEQFEVHFNPESLQYTITNNMKNTGSGNSATQYVDKSTGKLTMDLIFDTTDSGEDVRLHSIKVAQLMEPTGSGNSKTPPVVEFEWGLYTFSGMVESYKETIDFFSSDGVPLRAGVNITIASQKEVFEGGSDKRRANTGGSLGGIGGAKGNGGGGSDNKNDTVATQPPPESDGRGITQTATQAGNPAAARAIAASNGVENLRFPGSTQLELTSGPLRIGVSSMTGVSADVGGAFVGLHAQASGEFSGSIELDRFLQSSGTAQLGIEGASAVSLSGQASLQGSASFKADVGVAGALKARIEFDGGE